MMRTETPSSTHFRTLVTTALEETWPIDESPVLFLGEWCRRFNRRHVWERFEHMVAPYHWDDRLKLHQDYLALNEVYESALKSLAEKLNAIHQEDRSLRYWRIIVGPWLIYFTHMVFDRWAMISRVFDSVELLPVRVVRRDHAELVPNDMEEFVRLFVGDAWNEHVFAELLRLRQASTIHVEASAPTAAGGLNRSNRSRWGSFNFRRHALDSLDGLSRLVSADDRWFMVDSYLGRRMEFAVGRRLGQGPRYWHRLALPRFAYRNELRQWKLSINDPSAQRAPGFGEVLGALVATNLPMAYLEGYRSVLSEAANRGWPSRPSAILTANAYSSDDLFKAWAAIKVEHGARLVIGQHGGGFGAAQFAADEAHQLSISDSFISWGWTEHDQRHVVPAGTFITPISRRFVAPSSEKDALLLGTSFPRYSYRLVSVPIGAGQYVEYLSDVSCFLCALPKHIRLRTACRFPVPNGHGQDEEFRLAEKVPDVRFEDVQGPLGKRLLMSRICISTYHGTTMLETLASNYPTLIFWNQEHWEMRESARPLFDQLEAVGVFHRSPESAARQLTSVWYNVPDWWSSLSVQAARKQFCDRFARRPEDLASDLVKVLKGSAFGGR